MRARGGRGPSGNVSVREDLLEVESIDQGSGGKGVRMGGKEEGGSGTLAGGGGGRKGHEKAG